MGMEIGSLEIAIRAQAQSANAEINALYSNLERVAVALTHSADSYRRASSEMRKLSNAFGSLSKLGSSSLKTMAAMNKAALALSKFGMAAFKPISGIKTLGNALSGLAAKLGIITPRINAGALSFGKLFRAIMPFVGIRSVFNWGKKAVDLASSLTEVQNVVENAFGEQGAAAIEDFTNTSIEKFGMAELSAKQFASRFQAMGVSMGITAKDVEDAHSNVAGAMADSYKETGDAMHSMAINLTQLTADMASFYNADQSEVAEALNSVYTGQTRALRQYGLDLTLATLQEWANKQGIEAKVSAMSQAEKTMLRYQYVIANTAMLQGDFSRTADTWANRTRVLGQQFAVLGSTVGNVVINVLQPLVAFLNSAMSKVIAFAESIGNALGVIFGWEIHHTPATSMADSYDGMADSLGGVGDAGSGAADGLGKANKAAKELQATVLGFDELNKLNDTSAGSGGAGGSGGSGGGSGGSGGGTGDGTGAQFEIVKRDDWFEQYASNIDTLYDLGAYIGETLTSAMESIPWDSIYEKARGFGTGLASFLNGLISPELFGALGGTIAGALNTVLNAKDAFLDKFDFTNLGESLASGVNTFFEDYDFGLKAKTFYKAVNGILDANIAAAKKISWKKLGTQVKDSVKDALGGISWPKAYIAAQSFASGLANFLNGLFDENTFATIGKTVSNLLNTSLHFLDTFGTDFEWDNFGKSIGTGIRVFFATFQFDTLATTLNTWAHGILRTVHNALTTPNWQEIGTKIGQFIKDINWPQAFAGIATIIGDALTVVIETAKGFFSVDKLGEPFETALDDIQKTCEDFVDAVDWEGLASSIGGIVDALAPAAKGFASGFISVFSALSEIGAVALNLIAVAFEKMADAFSKIDPETLERVGEALGLIVGQLVIFNGIKKVVDVIGGVAGGLFGMGAASGVATTGVNAVGEAAGGAATGGLLGFLGKLGPLGAGVAAFAATLFGNTMVLEDHNDEMVALAEASEGIVPSLSDMQRHVRENEAAQADYNEAVRDGGKYQYSYNNDVTKTIGNTTNLREELKALRQATKNNTSTQTDYNNAVKSGSKYQYSYNNDVTSTIGNTTYLREELKILRKRADELGGTSAATAITNIGKASKDTTSKSEDFKSSIWKLAAGIGGKTLLMAVLGATFTTLGEKSDSSKEKLGTFDTAVGELVRNISSKAADMAKAGKDYVNGFVDPIKSPTNQAAAKKAAENLGSSASGGLISILDIQGLTSKVAEKHGNAFSSGVGIGVDVKKSEALQKSEKLAADLSAKLNPLPGNAKTKGQEISSNLGTGIESNESKATGGSGTKSGMAKVVKAILDKITGKYGEFNTAGSTILSKLKSGWNENNSFDDIGTKLYNKFKFGASGGVYDQFYSAGSTAGNKFVSGMKSVNIPTLQVSMMTEAKKDAQNNRVYVQGSSKYNWVASTKAVGGFPNIGELFIANEAGPEMIGKMGHRNVVANNMQITNGIRAAVVDGMMEVMMASGHFGNNNSSIPYELHAVLTTEREEVLARAVQRGELKNNDRNPHRF